MSRVLVTGGTGVLGSELVPLLRESGHTVRIMSRRPLPASLPAHTEWAQAQIGTGQGIADALHDVQVIYHAASSPFRQSQQVDIEGTQRLLDAAKQADVAHFIYISIVGIEKIPFSYYRHKVAAEKIIVEGGVPWTILRATQFHNLLDLALQAVSRLPVMFLPTDFPFQPVDVTEVAARLAACVDQSPAGRLPDLGGPEVLRLADMVRVWLRARQMNRLVVRLPLWGKTAEAFRKGYHTNTQSDQGTITWAEWVERTYSRKEYTNERIHQL